MLKHLSQILNVVVECLSPNDDITPLAMLGQSATIEIATLGAPRFLHGIITEFGFQGEQQGGNRRLYRYVLRMRGWLWLDRTTSQCQTTP